MKKTASLFLLLTAAVGLALAKAQAFKARPLTQAEARRSQDAFEVQRVADGVYALIRKEPLGLWFEANNVFIVNDDDVVVVDANISVASTKETVAALRKLTPKPVRYVINTHWHEDHIIGNQVWREAFPGVDFIGHASALKDFRSEEHT